MKRVISCLLVVLCFNVSAKDSQTIWQKNKNVYIALASSVSGQNYNNDHPASVNKDQLSASLSSLSLSDGEEQEGLFSKKQVNLLVEHLPNAFSRARSNQDVIFVLDKSVSSWGGLNKTEQFTAGRFFFQNDTLQLIIGDVNRPRDVGYEAAYDPTRQGLVKYDFDFGDRNKPAQSSKYTIVPPAGGMLVTKNGKNRQNWVQLQLDEVSNYVAQQEEIKQQGGGGLSRQQVQEMIDASRTPDPQPATRQVTPQPEPVVQAEAKPQNKLAERFKTLESLWKQKLITDEEYQQKRKELLSEL